MATTEVLSGDAAISHHEQHGQDDDTDDADPEYNALMRAKLIRKRDKASQKRTAEPEPLDKLEAMRQVGEGYISHPCNFSHCVFRRPSG